ncbi:hypothetical protein M231_01786 [Tremella mesenterica]|uniref:Uncharacterized protein n=1 Tax=Tremella mesenterica TaxID=5217 RepID=A0A4Q1BSK6_TREME|nr:hypothetical protein M231_01786 [Tremella mesenterica]
MDSPERRSAADLQRILDSLIGDAGFVLSGDLPDVLFTYEKEHDIVILDPSEYESLRMLCVQHADLELGPKEMFSFLSSVYSCESLQSPAPGLPHSSSMPPSSFSDQSTPQARKPGRRRYSDRIRSPSDSSSSSSDNEDVTQRFEGQSAPTARHAFPQSATQASFAPRPVPPKRTKTLSDPSRFDSPLTARVRGAAQPPSAFGFARPSPISRRRRGSAGATGSATNEEGVDVAIGKPFTRTTSSMSITTASPAMSARDKSLPTSPISPTGLDHTSFHLGGKSPDEEEMEGIERLMSGPQAYDQPHESTGDEDEIDGDLVSDTLSAMGQDSLNPRLSHLSTESTNSLRTSHDKLRALQKQNTELSRKLKESERQLAVLGSENERLVEDLQNKLEDARMEISQKRKDENDLRGKERANNIQIAGLEADILSLQRSLENSKTNHANMQKMYNTQCDEAERLRMMLRARDTEIKEFEEAAEAHQADEDKTRQEIEALEHEVKRLEEDLAIARQAENILETQKQENLQLKETIDRMRFDLDEARTAAANAGTGSGHSKGLTSSSGHPTLSRNLGDELNRRLLDAEKARDDEEDGYVETIVTTQRTRKVGNRNISSTVPSIRVEEGIKEYADASTETDPLPDLPSSSTAGSSLDPLSPLPPAYSAEPPPINKQEVLDHAHPRIETSHDEGDVYGEYDAVVEALGVRCTVLEDKLKGRSDAQVKRDLSDSVPSSSAHSRTSSFSDRRRSGQRPGIVNYFFYTSRTAVQDQVGKFAVWSVLVFAVGIIAGSHLYSPSGIHPRDYHLFHQMNTLAVAAGVGEGFLPIGHKGVLGFVESGARMVAGRVPS